MGEDKPQIQLLGNSERLMKIEVGKTYKNHYGAKIEIFEAPIEGKCRWFKGKINNSPEPWNEFPYYFYENGLFVQLDGDSRFNLSEEV